MLGCRPPPWCSSRAPDRRRALWTRARQRPPRSSPREGYRTPSRPQDVATSLRLPKIKNGDTPEAITREDGRKIHLENLGVFFDQARNLIAPAARQLLLRERAIDDNVLDDRIRGRAINDRQTVLSPNVRGVHDCINPVQQACTDDRMQRPKDILISRLDTEVAAKILAQLIAADDLRRVESRAFRSTHA